MLNKFKKSDWTDIVLRICMLLFLVFEMPVIASFFTARSSFNLGWIFVWAGTSLLFIDGISRSIRSWKEPRKNSFIGVAAIIALGLAMVSGISSLTSFFWSAGIFGSVLMLAEIFVPNTMRKKKEANLSIDGAEH